VLIIIILSILKQLFRLVFVDKPIFQQELKTV
jgi:hypothetical protein